MPIRFSPHLIFVFFIYLAFFSFLRSAVARGPHHSSLPSGVLNGTARSSSSRLLLQDALRSHFSDDMARGYMTNSELEKAVKEFEKRCSNISRIYSIGNSVNAVPLWVIEISDKPGEEEPEPAFKLIGNVHGDEPVGRELLMLLANWICDNQVKDPLARLIVENIHLHILPSMNPDGFSLRRRENANKIDLNRDFPDQWNYKIPVVRTGTVQLCTDERQPETRAVMNWLREIQFTASASLHGGALVANYPWDGTEDGRTHYYACPDDDTFRFMASLYSNSHQNMSLSREYPGGITNGASWYPIYGGMQDWNYIHAGCFELTLEISDNKWPNANELPTLWEYNKLSLLNLVASLVKTGVHGRILSSDSGRPLPASITIEGINYVVKAGKTFADYHRLLSQGQSYKVTASMPGYKSKTTCIQVGESATSLDFILDPEILPTMTTTIMTMPMTMGNVKENINDCQCRSSGKPSLDIFWRIESEVYVVVIVTVLALLCILLKRRIKLNVLNHQQQLPKRTAHR